jgi:hypothetical protein
MPLNMNECSGLGGHLRVGPQLHPQNYNGAKVIQRGPHGMMLAPGPSYVPGKGFRWWSEQIVQTAPWQPQQLEVGVLGMGDGSGRVADRSQRVSLDAASKSLFKASKRATGTELNILQTQIMAHLSALASYRPFAASGGALATATGAVASFFTLGMVDESTFGTHGSSQDIRSVLQQAQQNVSRRMAGGKALHQAAFERSGEKMSDHAGSEITSRGGSMFAAGARAIEDAEDSLKTAGKNPYSTALLVGGIGLLGLAVYSYASGKGSGPTIRVG